MYTAQGFEYDWSGVIIGPDLVVRNGKLVTRRSESRDPELMKKKAVSDDLPDHLIRNTLQGAADARHARHDDLRDRRRDAKVPQRPHPTAAAVGDELRHEDGTGNRHCVALHHRATRALPCLMGLHDAPDDEINPQSFAQSSVCEAGNEICD